MSALPSLIGLSTDELIQVAREHGQSAYRGRQLALQVYGRGVTSFEAMSDLPAAWREKLAAEYVINPLQTKDHRHSTDEVDKLLVHSGDDQVFECVLLPYPDRVSCCLSTQVGCPMGCVFCATGLNGFTRNLTVAEIVGQYQALRPLSPRRISHVVFMGMGEPLLNFDNLLQAMKVLHDEIGLSYRHMTVSTVGLVPQIDRLTQEGLPIHLALSLHSSHDDVRSRLMPVNQKWPVQEVMQAMRRYQSATKRKVTFEYLLIEGVNDSNAEAKDLAKMLRGLPHVVNLIPWNWVDTGYGFTRPTRETVTRFKNALAAAGANVTERQERGHDIAAACGQLAGQHQGRFAQRREPRWVVPAASPSS